MSWVATAIAGGAAISAGGTLGAGAMAGSGAGSPRDMTYISSQGLPQSNLLVSLPMMLELASYGMVDASVLEQASPFNRALSLAFQQNLSVRDRDRYWGVISMYRKAIENGESPDTFLAEGVRDPYFSRLAALVGMTPQEFAASETKFQSQIAPIVSQLQTGTQGNLGKKLEMVNTLAGLGGDLVGTNRLPALEESYRNALTRDISFNADQQRQDLLKVANYGNFNPGRALGDLERERFNAMQDIDITALTKATQALANANASVGSQANVLQALLGQSNPNLLAAATQFSAPTIAGVQADQSGQLLGSGVGGATNQIGSALSMLGMLKMLGPATGGTGG